MQGAAGYKGIVTIDGVGYPYTNETIAETQNIITPDVNGSPTSLGISEGGLTRQGNITFPILGRAMLYDMLQLFIKSETERRANRTIIIDNSFSRQTYHGALGTFELTADPGGGLSATCGIRCGVVDSTDVITYGDSTGGTLDSKYVDKPQIPFWRTLVEVGTSASGVWSAVDANWVADDVSGWSISLDNQIGGTFISAATAIDPQGERLHMGQQKCSGNITLINPYIDGNFKSKPNGTCIRISVYDIRDYGHDDSGGTYGYKGTPGTIFIPIVKFGEYGVPLPEPNTRITQRLGYQVANNLIPETDSSTDSFLLRVSASTTWTDTA